VSSKNDSFLVISDLDELKEKITGLRFSKKSISFVPTMGALHDGHLALVEDANRLADIVIVSIFVNPKQFGEGEDYQVYPRQIQKDIDKLLSVGVSVLYIPDESVMYPNNFQTSVNVSKLSLGLCGKFRPGHFQGVATVVTKLLLHVSPDYLILGEKDFQQFLVVRQLVSDLDLPLEVIAVPVVRDFDGLAISSRNLYMTQKERKIAPKLYKELKDVAQDISQGKNVKERCIEGIKRLIGSGFCSVDYLELCDCQTLELLKTSRPQARVMCAATIGHTRLIDNVVI